ncbi:MAG: HAMP domain-containing histidine kinase [Cyanobacteria bacterium K_DeepCast_35m_m2_023]|nr:HAMP domain-containing histidine kinase [Cyanobacteria bacterium K_DeepCast_35m_m2_023]
MALSARDSRDLLLACLQGMGWGVLAIAAAGLIWRLAGRSLLPAAGLLLLLGVLVGAGVGVVLFVQRRLWEPLERLIRALPRRATQKMTLVVDQGIAPLRLLSHRINELLNHLQGIVAQNQQEFTVLAHDLRGPLTRLLLRMQDLRQQQPPDAELMAGLEADVRALVAFDQELAELAQPSGRSLTLD